MIKLKSIFNELGIEYRPIVAGNLLLHPFLKKWKDTVKVPNAEILNNNGVYIGNNQFITEEMIDETFKHIKKIFIT
jgi:CDP-6-deoxy-D-xylo-4-hexulose-3-dehydrase